MGKLKVGVIGAGRIGRIHIENLLRMPDVEVPVICDAMAGPELEQWAADRGIGKISRASGEIIADPGIDAVFICSSTPTHVPLIIKATWI